MLVSDTLLTHRTLWNIETNKDGLRDTLATKCMPAGGVEQTHAFDVALLGVTTAELLPPAVYGAPRHFEWSEIRFSESVPNVSSIFSDMHIALRPRADIKPFAIVLQDPIGIASELHYQVTNAVADKTKYAGKNAHKLQSATLIANYFESMKAQAAASPDLSKVLARQRNLVNYAGAMSFPDIYSKRIKEFEKAIATTVNDSIAWVMLIGPNRLLGKALSCFDLTSLHNARDYESAVFQCIGGLVHTKDGATVIEQLITLPIDKSPYWLALANGNELLLARLRAGGASIAKNMFEVMDKFMEEHAITPATNALIGLLQALPQSKQADILVRRLRHVAEIRANATIVGYELPLAHLERAAYEFQGYQSLGPERLRGWKMPSPRANQADLEARVLFYDWVKVGETTYRELDSAPDERPALPPARAIRMEGNPFVNAVNRMRGPAGHFFTGLGGYLALVGMINAQKELSSNRDNTATKISVWGAGSALIGAAIEISASVVAEIARVRGTTALATVAKVFSAKSGIAIFGAGGAGLAAAAEAVRAVGAFNTSNRQQGLMFLFSAISSGVLAVATWAGGMAIAATVSGGGGAVAFLGLTPGGWAIIALGAIVAIIGFALGVDITKHGPVEIWLKHSAWGVDSRHYTNTEELDAVYSLNYRPRLTAEWDRATGHSVGTLRINCELPGINDMPGERFQTTLSFTLRGTKITRVNGPIMHAAGINPINYDSECLVTPIGGTGKECGWSIQMHKDTKVALEYLYFPDPERQPGLALQQPDAPAALVFTSDGWFKSPIDPAKLEPVRDPR
ncbi:hypothetical protein KYC_01669 [Achromobacter arsenitoxydans SY8]|uniref:Uncharacterized protein n=1 Tax=Achromobacter arsenitoxydans SY8 TaxID=477184 RepID=H0F0Q2_9BURK|nr:hypothetical protein KYC_01669 [Achromobacter arsenitoxydans SY8]